ncbi:MAG: 3-oxoacyl-ACP reductase FabG [Rhodobiaceae bacterium]|nr:3-oxoacyl-ACP reductase FabG [Rhodobiaceae bacterium]
MAQLAGKVALVTGGAKSIGRTFAQGLAQAGANIVIADIAEGETTAKEIATGFGVAAIFVKCDVSDETQVRQLIAAAIAKFGRIDILVNNAAYFAAMPLHPAHELPVELWDKVMAVNVRGSFLTAKHAAPHMMKAKSGKIINISSGTAYKGMPDMAAYVASKAAVLGLTRTLAREFGPHGINVNTLAPGLIESESLLENPRHLAPTERILASRAIARKGLPRDLVGGLLFLASPASDFMTGQTLAIDGGSINT